MAEEKSEKKSQTEFSRRSFLKGLTATGAVVAAISSGVKVAKADPYGKFLSSDLPKEKLLWMYDTMVKGRYFDLLLAEKMIKGDPLVLKRYPMLHTCCGQEAVATGVIAAMNKNDWCYTSHRCSIHNIARDMEMGKMFGTAIYKATGYTKGYGNHFHISDKAHKVPNIEGLIGLAPLIAAGTAYGEMVQKSGNIVVKFSGDGDYQWPDTLCALNEAANFKLPIVFIIENNGYQIWVRTDETTPLKDLADRGKGFGIPGVVVDGQDVLAVYNAAKPAIDKARAGGGPTIVECKTYRYFDHFGVRGYTPGKAIGSWGMFYRSDKELQHWLTKDPIDNFRRTLISQGVVTESEAENMKNKAKNEVNQAWEWCLQQPNPKAEDALKNARVGVTELPRQLADCPLYA